METHETKNPMDLFKVLGEMTKSKNINIQRPLFEIATEIRKDWVKVSPYAEQYLKAMSSMSKMEDGYMMDSGYSIIAYFLNSATGWRGETARRVKKELKNIAGIK